MESNSSSSVSRPLFKRIGTLLRVPFQALFQPAELEKSFAEKSMRKRILWIHLALSLAFYTVLTLSLKLFFSGSGVLVAAFFSSVGIYLVVLVIALVFGGIFKRDTYLSFVIGTCWGWFYGAFILSIVALSDSVMQPTRDIVISSSFPLTLAVVGALICNVRGRTGGIVYASYFITLIVAIFLAFYLSSFDNIVDIKYFEGRDTGHEVMLFSIPEIKYEFNGILFFSSYERSDNYWIELKQAKDGVISKTDNPYQLTKINMVALDAFLKSKQKLDLLTPEIRDKLAALEVEPTSSLNEEIKKALGDNSFFLSLPVSNFKKIINASSINGEIHIENKNKPAYLFDEEIEKGFIVIRKKPSSATQEKSPQGFQKPTKIAGTKILNNIMLGSDKVFVQTDKEAQMFIIKDNEISPLWNLSDKTQLQSLKGLIREDNNSLFVVGNVIYLISPSCDLLGVSAADGSLLFTRPLYNIAANTAKMGSALGAFYISLGVFALCLGLYQIPIYLLETPLQLIGLLQLRRGPKDLDRAINKIPMFFDHVSTLPPAFGGAILRKIAAADPKVCAQRLVYLFVQTQHQRLAARLFEELHEANPQCLFANLYQWLRSGQYNLVCDFSQALSPDKPVGNLLRSYADLINQASKKPQLERHETLLRLFANRNYHHAEELLLIYSAFHRFLASDSLQALAVVDEALAEPLKLTYSEVLIPQLYDAFNIIVEMANDLRNYDVVESYRDKQYYLSEARIKLYEISRKSRELQQPEQGILLEVVERWQDLIVAEAKSVRGPADLEVLVLNDSLPGTQEWHSLSVNLKNVGKSPAENIRLRLLENEYILVQETDKTIRLLGTGDSTKVEFAVYPRGNPTELRMFFDIQFDDFQRKDKQRPFADVVKLTSDVQEFRKAPNPYIVGTPLQNLKVFFGRETALNFAIENLSAGEQNNALIFFGQRRVGKSSILYRLMETPLADCYLFTYIDCQGFADADTASLLHMICDEINKSATKRQIFLESPDIQAFKSDPFLALDAYLDRIEPLLGTKRVALMFDEYEFLEYKVKEGRVSSQIFNKLRNLIQHRNQRFAFIFVGTHQLTELTGDYWSILFNIALYHEIGPLSPEAARALVIEPVKGYIRYDELAVDKILRATGLHPYFIQVTCRLIVNYCNRNQKPYITLQDVKEILKEAVEGSTAHVKYLYKDYATQPEQEALAFLSRLTDDTKLFASVTEVGRYAQEAGFDIDRQQLAEILSGLKNKKLVREEGEVRGELFGFEYEFLRLWIEEHVKIHSGLVTTS